MARRRYTRDIDGRRVIDREMTEAELRAERRREWIEAIRDKPVEAITGPELRVAVRMLIDDEYDPGEQP